jgi:ribonuclease D
MDLTPPGLPELVESAAGLANLVAELSRQKRIAVDTESNSLHAYREQVCLIQFSTAEGDYIVDPLGVPDLTSLASIFSDPGVEKIFHAAEYDLLCLRRDFGYSFASIFDTMQAGRILGRKQAGLDRLLEEKLGVTHSKHFQKADWGVRPLSRDLMLYAALDTHYLIALRDLLEAELEDKGLWPLAQEDFAMACNGAAPRARDESAVWTRFSFRRDLSARELTVLKELTDWREATAARLDRPPFKVLDDDRLVDIARAQPGTLEELQAAGLGARQMENWGRQLLEAIGRGLVGPLVQKKTPQSHSAIYVKRLDKLKRWRKKTAEAMDVESDVVLPRSLLLALAESGIDEVPSIMKSSPWRLEHFGDQVADVLRSAPPLKSDTAV